MYYLEKYRVEKVSVSGSPNRSHIKIYIKINY